MRPIATNGDGVAWSVCVSVSLSVGHVHELCQTVEPIEMRFGGLTRISPRNHLENGQFLKVFRSIWGFSGPVKCIESFCYGVRSKNDNNTTCDAASCQVFDHLFYDVENNKSSTQLAASGLQRRH